MCCNHPLKVLGDLFCINMKYRDYYKKFFEIQFDNSFDIHHINGNREDNDISNLVLLPKILHRTLHKVLYNASFCESAFDYILHFSTIDDKTYKNIKDLFYWVDLKEQATCEKYNSMMEGRRYINFYQTEIEKYENRI